MAPAPCYAPDNSSNNEFSSQLPPSSAKQIPLKPAALMPFSHQNPTLQQLMASNPITFGILSKLSTNAPDDSPVHWKQRYFVLTQEANLYFYRTNSPPMATNMLSANTMPLSTLRVTSCCAMVDASTNTRTLQVHGPGLTLEESNVKRTWSLRVGNEEEFRAWFEAIQGAVLERDGERRVSGSFERARPETL